MSSANNGSWTHIRIRRETLDRLQQLAKQLDAFYNRTGKGEPPGEQGYSADQLVRLLLDRDDDHRERSRRQWAKKAPRSLGKGSATETTASQG
jgi:hypothetical protein